MRGLGLPPSVFRLITKAYVFFILFLPVAIIENTAIYSTTSPGYILYKYLDYNFSALAIPGLILASLIFRHVHVVPFFRVLVLVLLWNIAHAIFVGNEIFTSLHLQMFLVMLQAWSLLVLIFFCYRTSQVPRFIDTYVILCFASQILRAVLGYSTEGRYGAIGLSVGGSGFLYATYVIYLILARDLSSKVVCLIGMGLLGLLLTGQRTNVAFLGFFLLLATFSGFLEFVVSKHRSASEKRKLAFLAGSQYFVIILIVLISYGYVLGYDFDDFQFVARAILAITQALDGNLEGVSSVSGRLFSLAAGAQVLVEHPLGLSNDFYDLQRNIQDAGYPTFPHSTFLSGVLLWSLPVSIIVFIYLSRLWWGLVRQRSRLHYPILYIITVNVFWGGPFLDYALLFVVLLFLSLPVSKRGLNPSGA